MCPERLGLLYLKSGGGHLSAARTIERAFKGLKSEVRGQGEVGGLSHTNPAADFFESVFTYNPVPDTRRVTSYLLGKGYGIASLKLPGIWIFLYDVSRLRFVQTIWTAIIYYVIRKQLRTFILQNCITRIGVLHFLLIRPVTRVLRDMKLSLPVCTIVTDPFTAHPMWFSPGKGPTIVFSEALKSRAVEDYGMKPERVHVFSPLIADGYDKSPTETEKASFKKSVGFDPNLPLVLFAGGGEGAPGAAVFLRNWLKTSPPAGLALVCGKDAELKYRLQGLAKKKGKACREIRIFGFIDFMAALMGSSDIVAVKAGPSTVLEAVSLNKPLFIYSYIYGQEKGNVSFALRRGEAFYMPDIKKLVRRIGEALTVRPGAFGEVATKKNVKISSGTAEVCRFLISFR